MSTALTAALLALGLACAAAADAAQSQSAAAFPLPGEWPCYRGNAALDGRSRLVGHIVEPRVAWKQFTGVADTTLVLEPARAGAATATISPDGLPATSPDPSDPAWGLTPPEGDIEGRLQPLTPSLQTTYADVLPEVPGLEKLEFESGFSKPTVSGQWQNCVGRCFAWRDGRWEQVWQTATIDWLFQPLPIVGDFDGDGAPEVAVLPFRELLILDARTGAVKDRCAFTEGRSYGFFGVYDLNGDGRSEFLVVADFAKHVDVVGYRAGKLSLLWQRPIELDISNPHKILRAHPRPAADVDGDGRPEVLVCAYNDTRDGRWHVTAHDGMTGAVKADLPDRYLQGTADLKGDGVAELLTSVTSGAGIPAPGTILVESLRGGRPAVLWRCEDAAWATWGPPLPANVNSGATFARRDVLCRGDVAGAWAAIHRWPRQGRPELAVLRWDGRGFRQWAAVAAPSARLEPLALDRRGRLLVRASTPPGEKLELRLDGARARALCATRRGGTQGAVVVTRPASRRRPLVLLQGADEDLVAVRAPGQGGGPSEAWRISGRGQNANWPNEPRGPVVADLRGDGGRQVLYATSSPEGQGRLVAADAESLRPVWHHDLPDIPGTPPVWNTGGVILWRAGHFTDRRRMDVLGTVRRSMMHSEETALLSGRDGRQLWRRDRQISSRGVGGIPFAVADYDGDGLDDAASFHPSIYYVLDGATGRDLMAMDATWDAVPAKPVYWGNPIAGDFEGDGHASTLFCGGSSMTGLVRRDGALVWWDALDRSPRCLPAVGDFDGDGRLEVLGPGYEDGVRCYDAATGKATWRLALPPDLAASWTISGDINGDGRDEAIFACGCSLVAVGATAGGDAGQILWRLDLPATLGPPAIADLGDGHASILTLAADGYLYCVR